MPTFKRLIPFGVRRFFYALNFGKDIYLKIDSQLLYNECCFKSNFDTLYCNMTMNSFFLSPIPLLN